MERRQLIIMRHATANGGGGRDHARRLTRHGRDEARLVGIRLRGWGPLPDRVLCSSAIRCRETWQAVEAGLGSISSATVDFEDELYNASAPTLLDAIARVTIERTLLLLAHNPGVSVLALGLGKTDEEDRERLRGGFAPASFACFTVDGPWSALSSESARLSRFDRNPEV